MNLAEGFDLLYRSGAIDLCTCDCEVVIGYCILYTVLDVSHYQKCQHRIQQPDRRGQET